MKERINALLNDIFKLYKQNESDYPEIASMTWEEFVEFEKDSYDVEKCDDSSLTEVDYYEWVRDNFGEWCSPFQS